LFPVLAGLRWFVSIGAVGFCLAAHAEDFCVLSFNIRYANPKDGPDRWENRHEHVAKLIRDESDLAASRNRVRSTSSSSNTSAGTAVHGRPQKDLCGSERHAALRIRSLPDPRDYRLVKTAALAHAARFIMLRAPMPETIEKHAFQAEIAQLLDLVVHSLYTDKEIFVRELISNAADATEKLKFLQTSGTAIVQPELPLKISVTTDDSAKTITFADAGIGMSHAELVENLGTIAHSGSKAFLEQLKANKGDANLIGQFGVGFYSAFMVAEKVTVFTRSYRPEEKGWLWTSDGQSGYEIEPAGELERGTKVVLNLREPEFARSSRIEQIIKHYSNFVQFPIELNGNVVNTVQALWTRNKSEITDTEYEDFYKYIGHDTEPPLYRLHFNADAPLAIRALLFAPSKNFEPLTLTRVDSEVSLYCKKVLIQPKAKGLFPEWLRFLKGVVDSEDLPLNISRETMQDSALMRKLNDVLTKRFLKFLDEESKSDPEKYDRFYKEHGHCLKEGVASDWTHRETLGKLLRFESSFTEKGKTTSLTDYVSRMSEEQKEIYYLLAPSRESAEASPYFEVFREKKFEVIFLLDPRDEFVMEHLREFDKKQLVAAEKADLKLDKESTGLSADEARLLANFIKETLGQRVGEVRTSKRLVGSPAVIVDSDKHMTSSMRRVMKMMNREGDATLEAAPDLEINPDHPMIVRLEKTRHTDKPLAEQVAEQIFDNALVSAGLLEDPRAMLARLNSLLEKVLARD
jgi:TNF receptor-associated protein 1